MARLVAAVLILLSALVHAADMDKYEIYAVRYATISGFRVSGLIAGADPSRRLDIAMMIWVLKGIDGVSFTFFGSKDVVRHPLVAKIVEAYDARDGRTDHES